jgi:hypothetical protein
MLNLVSFATQIVVTGQLSREMHSSLRVLSKAAQAEDIKIFLEEAEAMKLPGDRNNISAVLRVSVDANQSVYDKIKEDETMGDALRELMKDELEEAHASGIDEGLLSSVGNLMKSMHLSAEEAMKALGIPKEKMDLYGAKLAK